MNNQKLALGASISTVNADQLSRSSAFNPENTLFGLLPGLAVMQNGGIAEGRSPDMFIRGRGTMNSANILVLVDGFERPLSSLSTAEIQTATVLKDAATLAEYGVRGANGVLLVTTKRGQNNTLKVDVTYQHGVNQAFRLPEFYGATVTASKFIPEDEGSNMARAYCCEVLPISPRLASAIVNNCPG